MSVILNALQSHKEGEKPPQEKLSQGEGIFLGKKGFVYREKKPPSKRNIVLAAILIFVVAFSLTMFWIARPHKTSVPSVASVPSAPIVSSPPISPPPVPSQPLPPLSPPSPAASPEENLKLLQKALEKNPEDPLLYNDIGLLYVRKELYSSAEAHFTKALELDSSCAECFNNLGYLKTLLGQSLEAEKYLKKSVLLKSDYADPHFNLGVLYEKKGDIGEAVTHFKRFLELKGEEKSELIIQLKQHLKELTGR